MNLSQLLFFSVLFIFQAAWLVCYDIYSPSSCPIQPLTALLNHGELKALKSFLITNMSGLIQHQNLFSLASCIGLLITISEVLLVVNYLIKIPLIKLYEILEYLFKSFALVLVTSIAIWVFFGDKKLLAEISNLDSLRILSLASEATNSLMNIYNSLIEPHS